MNNVQRGLGATIKWTVMIVLLGAMTVAGLGSITTLHAQASDGGEFEGAVWRFVMTAKVKGGGVLRGQFRVKDDVLYQKASEKDKEFSKAIGRNHPESKGKTRMELSDFRARDKKGAVRNGLKGTARLTINSFGSWSGDFTDSAGKHWNIKCERIKE